MDAILSPLTNFLSRIPHEAVHTAFTAGHAPHGLGIMWTDPSVSMTNPPLSPRSLPFTSRGELTSMLPASNL